MVEVQFNVFDCGLDSQTEPVDLMLTIGESRIKSEVNVRRLDKDSLRKFLQAKSTQLDKWISNGVVSTSDQFGVTCDRIMSMRWICTWKPPEIPTTNRSANARPVARSYTVPDLTSGRPGWVVKPCCKPVRLITGISTKGM